MPQVGHLPELYEYVWSEKYFKKMRSEVQFLVINQLSCQAFYTGNLSLQADVTVALWLGNGCFLGSFQVH